MKICNIQLESPVVLAPMAGVTDLPFRLLAKEMGCGLVYSEMISDKGLLFNNLHTVAMLEILPQERPVSIQIFGSEPEPMAKAAQIVERYGVDIIDINMGCPTPKIVKNGEGSALMRNPKLAGEIMQAVAKAVSVPVTVKIRKGWDDQSSNAVEMAKIAEQSGMSAIAVHGRTREQFYMGQADWGIIAEVKQNVSIPVIGNGDIRSPQDAADMLKQTGCDGVMVGRGSQGNPWIFKQITQYLQSGQRVQEPPIGEKVETMLRHLTMLIEYKGEYVAVREMRKHASWYIKGWYMSSQLRNQINKAETRAEMEGIIKSLASSTC